MSERTTYESNAKFIELTVKRLEQNQVSIDDLELLAKEFAEARAFCEKRLKNIEVVLQQTLVGDQVEQ